MKMKSVCSNTPQYIPPVQSPPQMSPGLSDDLQHLSMDGSSPSRSLWVGNIDTSLPSKEILAYFLPFGQIESIRMLPEKDCAFINYVNLDDAMAAKEAMQGGHVGNCIVKIGYGKVESSEGHGPQATKSLCKLFYLNTDNILKRPRGWQHPGFHRVC